MGILGKKTQKQQIIDKEVVTNKSTKKNNGRKFPVAEQRHMSSDLCKLMDIQGECKRPTPRTF